MILTAEVVKFDKRGTRELNYILPGRARIYNSAWLVSVADGGKGNEAEPERVAVRVNTWVFVAFHLEQNKRREHVDQKSKVQRRQQLLKNGQVLLKFRCSIPS